MTTQPIPLIATRRRGFSLVLSLTVMTMLLLLCISIAAMMTIELRLGRSSISQARARWNALSGARIALGELQTLVGNDRRITAPASILDNSGSASANQSASVNLPRLTGVWKGQSVTSNYADTHRTAFRGWLASGTPSLSDSSLIDYPKNKVITESNGVQLFKAPVNPPTDAQGLEDRDKADVFVEANQIKDINGNETGANIAWWVADENTKANLSLRLPAASDISPLQAAQNATRFGLKLTGDGELANFPEAIAFNSVLIDRGSLMLDSATAGSNTPWLSNSANYFHHITPYSESLLTDVVNGGLKYDLSLMMSMDQLPVGYVGDTAYVGLEGSSATSEFTKAKSLWLTADIKTDLSVGALSPNNLAEWTRWGDVWNYARLYQHKSFDSTTGMLINSAADAHGNSSNSLDPTNKNVPDLQNLSPWREPVITQMQFVLGYRVKPSASSPGKYDLYMVMRPYIQLWNPYNVPLKFTGNDVDSFLARIVSMPGRVEVTCNDSSGGGGTKNSNSWSDFLSQSGNFNVFQPYIDFKNTSINTALAPGEIRVLSPQSNAIVSNTKLDLTPGLRPFGGFETLITNPAGPLKPFDGNVTIAVKPATGGWFGYTIWADLGRTKFTSIYQKDSPCRSWGVNFTATDSGTSKQLMDFDTTPVTSTIGQLSGQGRFCALITMRLRSETTSNLKFPVLGYGDPLRWSYNLQAKSNYLVGQDVRLSPYEFIHSKIISDIDAPPANPIMNVKNGTTQGYALTGFTPATGVSNFIFSPIPLAPLGSMSELRHARLGGGAAYARNNKALGTEISKFVSATQTVLTGASVVQDAFGNSFMHPMVTQSKIIGTSDTFLNEKFFDFSWIMNSALWDSYCITGLTPYDSTKIPSSLLPGGLPKTLDQIADEFFTQGKSLPNQRLLLRDNGVGGAALKSLLVSGGKPTEDAFSKSAAFMSVKGGFNINSTSVRAWRALLAGLNGADIPSIESGTGIAVTKQTIASTDNPVIRMPIQMGPLTDANNSTANQEFNKKRTTSGRKITDEQLTVLAQKIVEQVKKRGPFLSLAEFMNRRLESGEFGEKGALQAAIDATDINKFAISGSITPVTAADIATLVPAFNNPAAVTGSQARGMPGYVTQADLIGPVASHLTPRSDTFTIRARGMSEDGASAYMEITVRRTANFVDPSNAPYDIPDYSNATFKVANRAFGRRFVTVSQRLLGKNEI